VTPRLCNLKQRAADLITIADAHFIVGQAFDRKILTELSVDEVVPCQLLLPVAIRFDLVHEYRPLLAPVSRKIALTVTVEIQLTYVTATRHGFFPDPRVDNATLPLDIAWQPDIH
jgi:hypothetical protein